MLGKVWLAEQIEEKEGALTKKPDYYIGTSEISYIYVL